MRVKFLLDVLKPHSPSVDFVAHALMEVEGVDRVRVSLDELDQKTASLHINIEGNDISFEELTSKLTELNCAIHSLDEVSIGRDDTKTEF
ncbi:hypothetical protein LCGC14_1333400 [marine sediment metagenome]|uniref:DUF211 domain-containing protein n=1 Tax=marine sediment metagenome TaxID=412755 RepID=A0A0F9NID1_9ZZZZ|nr:hypothetical protein [bacterium]